MLTLQKFPTKLPHTFFGTNIRMTSSAKSDWVVPTGHNTGIFVQNSLSGKLDELILKQPSLATWYMCGPTVYDSPHIGHGCSYVRFDIIRRILENVGKVKVFQVMGMTDIDDKIIARCHQKNITLQELTRKYEDEFSSDMLKLNVMKPSLIARVSEHIPQIEAFIAGINSWGLVYNIDGSLYFDVENYKNYGKFKQECEWDKDSTKKSNRDFALWKKSKPNEPYWKIKLGEEGRPGWHIECSSMASYYFGDEIDIHSGGIDLKFPHHENEEAQSCAYFQKKQWVNYWLHSGHLLFYGDKMSKSIGNTITIREFLKEYSPIDFRIFCLLSHFSKDVKFSEDSMDTATGIHRKLVNFLCSVKTARVGVEINGEEILQKFNEVKMKVHQYLLQNFNTPSATMEVLTLVDLVNKVIHDSHKQQHHKYEFQGCCGLVAIEIVATYIKDYFQVLGIELEPNQRIEEGEEKWQVICDQVIKEALQLRSSVRDACLITKKDQLIYNDQKMKEKLLIACDSFRDNLGRAGISIKDHSKSSVWSKTR